MENNYFENIDNLNSDMPMIWVQAEYVRIKNTTVVNSKETFHKFLIDFEESAKECKITDEVELFRHALTKRNSISYQFNCYQIG
jgi:hypothetical protein